MLQIRRWRKELSKSARASGFALCTQYTLDASALSLAQVHSRRVIACTLGVF